MIKMIKLKSETKSIDYFKDAQKITGELSKEYNNLNLFK